jgi:hypothetical protein
MRGSLRMLLVSESAANQTKTFDSAVKGIGRVIVLIRSTAGHIFGCYVRGVFGTAGGARQVDDPALLFALGNLTGAPVKLKAAPGAGHVNLGSCGLHLGPQSGNELVAFCGSNNTYTPLVFTAPQSFPGGAGAAVQLTPGFLCGTPGTAAFTPARMEVYTFTA